jgi:hypothetical protein
MVCAAGRERGKKKGGGRKSSVIQTYLRRPSFSLFDPVRDAPFRKARSAEAESPLFNNLVPGNYMN